MPVKSPTPSPWRELSPCPPEVGDYVPSPEPLGLAGMLSSIGLVLTWLWPFGVEPGRWLTP